MVFVNLIGVDKTADLFLAFGGSLVDIGRYKVSPNNAVAKLIGVEDALKIGEWFCGGKFKVPLGKRFLSRYLITKGMTQQRIARTLHIDDSTVARHLKPFQAGKAGGPSSQKRREYGR